MQQKGHFESFSKTKVTGDVQPTLVLGLGAATYFHLDTLRFLCCFGCMPRFARTVAVGFAHHLTQWGDNRQKVFFVDDQIRRAESGPRPAASQTLAVCLVECGGARRCRSDVGSLEFVRMV